MLLAAHLVKVFITLSKFLYLTKPNPGNVLAFAPHLGVFGAGLQPDGPGCPETLLYDQNNHHTIHRI